MGRGDHDHPAGFGEGERRHRGQFDGEGEGGVWVSFWGYTSIKVYSAVHLAPPNYPINLGIIRFSQKRLYGLYEHYLGGMVQTSAVLNHTWRRQICGYLM